MALTLLLVDGHERVRTALTQRLQHAPGISVVGAAADIQTAVHLSHTLTPDVVLYEPKTIPGDARASLHALRAAGPPVVVWTASLWPGEAVTLRRAGAVAVLLKDVDLNPLLATLGLAAAATANYASNPNLSCSRRGDAP